MHTVHLLDKAEKGFFASALGIIFDELYYDSSVTEQEIKMIDSFFDSLQLDKLSSSNAKVDITAVPYGQLINMVNTNKRWVYKGSLTTPDCNEIIYWNVVYRVYPIKARHLQAFQNLIKAE